MSYTHSERVRFGDLDAMRHLNNVVFLRYFETARIAYLRDIVPDHDPANPEQDEFGLIFAECHINYRSPVLFDEVVDVKCSIGTVRRSSFRVEFEMRVGSRLAAEGYGVLVGFDYTTQRASQLPDVLRETLEREAGEPAPAAGS
jgi:acyl-CoA thioester hydrolase